MSISAEQRFSRSRPCPVCGGFDAGNLRGKGARCYGWLSEDGRFAYCTREELANGDMSPCGFSNAYRHRTAGLCPCGTKHGNDVSLVFRHDHERKRRNRKPEALQGIVDHFYVYYDERGQPLHRTVRFRDPKSFRQQRFESGRWRWGLADVRRVLYRLPQLLYAPDYAPILFVEGEKDADQLADLGMVATASVSHDWQPHYADWLRGRDIIIVEDNDHSGRLRSAMLTELLSPTSGRLRVVSFDAAPVGYDASDFLADGHSASDLLDLAREPRNLAAAV